MSSRPLLIVLPGGPGLTCDTLQELIRNFGSDEVLALDPSSENEDWSYDGLLGDLEARIPKDRPVAICGHSFGGIQATDLALQLQNVIGLVCVATPFSSRAWESVGAEFEKRLTPTLVDAGARFDEEPSNENFREWVANYGLLYFTARNVERGGDMIRRSKTIIEAYRGASADASRKGSLLEKIRATDIPRLFLYGEQDGLVTPESAKAEANAGGFAHKQIPGASHFVTFDQPELTTNEIIDFLNSLNYKGDKQ